MRNSSKISRFWYTQEERGLKNRLTGVKPTHIEKLWADGKGKELIPANHFKDGDAYSPQGVLWLIDRSFQEKLDADSATLGGKSAKKDL